MNIKELKQDNLEMKKRNDLLSNKLAGISRLINAYAMMGKTEVPIEQIFKIIYK